MPAEVLSYFLKHRNIWLKLRFQLVFQCAPFLKGIKIAESITVDALAYEKLGMALQKTGITYRKLWEEEGKCLVFFYRKVEMKKYLSHVYIRGFLREYGYENMECEEMLNRLSDRVNLFAQCGEGFPHEIGIFLGYPVEDVGGFIKKAGKDFLLTGYWKVYANPIRTKQLFDLYDQTKNCAVNEFLSGRSIEMIVQKDF